jgi:hypothetical protein
VTRVELVRERVGMLQEVSRQITSALSRVPALSLTAQT